MPKASWIDPSLAAAMAQTFSVQDRSDWATVAKVSVIWWWKVSSAGTRGPRVGIDGSSRQLGSSFGAVGGSGQVGEDGHGDVVASPVLPSPALHDGIGQLLHIGAGDR